ncbi:hypothetical protein IGI43_002597 [Enterococcus sp. AZ126]
MYLLHDIVILNSNGDFMMKKVFVLKMLSIVLIGGVGLVLGSTSANAASFEDVKGLVESGEGLIYNPVSDGILTKESSVEFVQLIESENENSNKDISEIMDNAYEETVDLETIPAEKSEKLPLIQPRGANIPTKLLNIDDLPTKQYDSNPFSASGWRYGEVKLKFRNSAANPYFAVRATKDSFYFYTNAARHTIPANGGFVLYPARKDGYGLWGYFATYNPVKGSRYFVN